MLLGGLRYLIPVIKAAHKLGCHVITVDYLPDNPAHRYSDEYYNVSIVNEEEITNLAKKLKIDGIMSFACDPGVTTAAYVANSMGLPGSPYESVCILQNKDKFRAFLQENGFSVPKARSYNELQAIYEDISSFKMPVIMKPTDSAGSKGVTRIDNITQISSAFSNAMSHSRIKRVIIEEFIEKRGHSSDTDCFSVEGNLDFVSFNCQYFDEAAENPYTPAGFIWPSDMPAVIQKNLRNELQRLISLLKMETSIYNVETRLGVDGVPYIMELSPRGGGNRLAELLKMACHTDLIKNNIAGALGLKVDELSDPVYDGVWTECILHANENGIFEGLEINNDFIRQHLVETDLWVKTGDPVCVFTGANETLGTIIMKFDTVDEAHDTMDNVKKWLKVKINSDKMISGRK